MKVQFKLNGRPVSCEVEPNQTLLDMLRHRFRITSVKRGCELGECGACTVLINGEPACSCLVLAPQVDGAEVLTVEGLSKDGELSELQRAFIEGFGFQCGYCTPGILLVTKALLDRNPSPSIADIMKALEGNLCRCTGYEQIISSILRASSLKGQK